MTKSPGLKSKGTKPVDAAYTMDRKRLEHIEEALEKNNVRLSDLINEDEEWELLAAMSDVLWPEPTEVADNKDDRLCEERDYYRARYLRATEFISALDERKRELIQQEADAMAGREVARTACNIPKGETLPDCMMPDGAEPCKGYRELHARLQARPDYQAAMRLLRKVGDCSTVCPECIAEVDTFLGTAQHDSQLKLDNSEKKS